MTAVARVMVPGSKCLWRICQASCSVWSAISVCGVCLQLVVSMWWLSLAVTRGAALTACATLLACAAGNTKYFSCNITSHASPVRVQSLM